MRSAISILLLSVASAPMAHAEDTGSVSGFYASSGDECLQATGVLYICSGDQCISQDYRFGAALHPMPVEAQASIASNAHVDANGFKIHTGDITLKYNRDGGFSIRVIRPSGGALLTTYAARTNASWKASYAFIKDGIAVDPSAKAEDLVQCPAYANDIAAWAAEVAVPHSIVARAEAPIIPSLEDRPTPKTSTITMNFVAPVERAHILDVIPVTMNDNEYPALFVFWALNLGGTSLPLQVLTYDRDQRAYIDRTAELFDGPVPLLDNPSAAAVAEFDTDGGIGMFISSAGMDREPFPRTTNTLLLPTSDGRLKDFSHYLPQAPQFSHDASAGTINDKGHIGIYVNDMYIPEYYISRRDGDLINAADFLPDAIHKDGPKFTASMLTDVNGDGAADLILGSADQAVDPSVIYLNNGSGRFDRSEPILLPRSPFPNRVLPITKRVTGPGTMDIQPIKLDPSQTYYDLVVVSNDGYRGHAVQILDNDGTGHFTDRSAELIDGPVETYFNAIETPYTWQKRAWVFDNNGSFDIVTKSEARHEIPSYVFTNDGTGHFRVAAAVTGNTIANAAMINGEAMLIELDGPDTIVLTAYPVDPT